RQGGARCDAHRESNLCCVSGMLILLPPDRFPMNFRGRCSLAETCRWSLGLDWAAHLTSLRKVGKRNNPAGRGCCGTLRRLEARGGAEGTGRHLRPDELKRRRLKCEHGSTDAPGHPNISA